MKMLMESYTSAKHLKKVEKKHRRVQSLQKP